MENIGAIVNKLEEYNRAYRNGKPLVTDEIYDQLVEKLRRIEPFNPFLYRVEPEKFDGKIEVRHPFPMLSTEKAYNILEIERFTERVKKQANEIDIDNVFFRVTPKLDGLAGRDDGKVFASRGNGEVGYNITNVFDKGVIPIGGRGLGLGEIAVVKSYFDKYLSEFFEHPRNMVVGIVSSDKLNEHAKKALKDKMVHFVPYITLVNWKGSAEDLIEDIEKITENLIQNTDYPSDGVVAEAVNPRIQEKMGATSHHYRWQIAIKTRGQTAETTVKEVIWQVGRTGNITPVLDVEQVSLSGATIRRVTAHNAGLVKKSNIGHGAIIKIIRSGEVIPKLEEVISTGEKPILPEKCPSCGAGLFWNNDFLRCENKKSCKAQIQQRISHWFKTLENADWFGIKTIQKIVESGWDSLEKVYKMKEQDFLAIGFGPVQSKNLAEAINISKTKQVQDWRFLAALGISNLGKAESRKILSYMKLDDLIKVSSEEIQKIHGFGEVTSKAIVDGIKEIYDEIKHLLSLNFNIEFTPLARSIKHEDKPPVYGKNIVFTGKMNYGTRDNMQETARSLGAIVQTSLSASTDYLVCGENAGEKKLEKAKKSGVKIISEREYFNLTGGRLLSKTKVF